MSNRIILALCALCIVLIGCGEPAPLPETVSRPKPAKLDKNAFVRTN